MHGGSRGEASYIPHSVLLKDLQGPGAFTTSCQHHLWLQGERGHLSAGKTEEEEGWRAEEGSQSRNDDDAGTANVSQLPSTYEVSMLLQLSPASIRLLRILL